MEAKELMIGDWVGRVFDDNRIIGDCRQVDWIRTGEIGMRYQKVWSIGCIEPIPLTLKILEKNGFRYDGFNEVYRWMTDAGCERHPTFHIFQKNCRGERYGDFYVYSIPMKFVHELQHALRLCGLNELADNFIIQ